MTLTQAVAADLRAAATTLRRDGWTQLRLTGPDGSRDVLSAIAVSSRRGGLLALLAFRDHIGGGSIAEWNDIEGRTAADVVGALEAAAAAELRAAA